MSRPRPEHSMLERLTRYAEQAARWVAVGSGVVIPEPTLPEPVRMETRTHGDYWLAMAMAGERVFVPCDRCGHRSSRDYVKADARILSLCEAHSRQHHDALLAAGFRCVFC